MIDNRKDLADDIRGLVNMHGANTVIVTMSKADALRLASDLELCSTITARHRYNILVSGKVD